MKVPSHGLGESRKRNLVDQTMKRILVTGPVGAGKSRLAGELGRRLGIRVLHLDTLFWKPGWVATPPDEFEAVQRRELATDEWIVDAQFDDMLRDWLHAADTVVFVDASPLRCLWRVSRRRVSPQRGVGTPAGTAPAAVHHALAKFLRNQWRYRRSVRRELLAELAREAEARRVVVLRRGGDTAAFLSSVDSPTSARGTL
jgi:adenylate kinase family enzyme